jgi:hypothetical protein
MYSAVVTATCGKDEEVKTKDEIKHALKIKV